VRASPAAIFSAVAAALTPAKMGGVVGAAPPPRPPRRAGEGFSFQICVRV